MNTLVRKTLGRQIKFVIVGYQSEFKKNYMEEALLFNAENEHHTMQLEEYSLAHTIHDLGLLLTSLDNIKLFNA